MKRILIVGAGLFVAALLAPEPGLASVQDEGLMESTITLHDFSFELDEDIHLLTAHSVVDVVKLDQPNDGVVEKPIALKKVQANTGKYFRANRVRGPDSLPRLIDIPPNRQE